MERLLLRPEEAAEALGICRSKLYQLIAAGVVPSVNVGYARRVPAGALRKWVENQATAGTPNTEMED